MTAGKREEIRAEAAAWLARLRNEQRDHACEADFQAWLAQSEDHRASFDAVTATFELAGSLKHELPKARRGFQLDRRAVMAGLGVAVAGVGWMVMAPTVYATGIGETRRINLEDGSSILLDAESKVRVEIDRRQRRVTLLRGRAFFKAARDPSRPFVVEAAGREVIGGGGESFDVRLGGTTVSVVAVEGELQVMTAGQPSSRMLARAGQKLTLLPGVVARPVAADAQTATAWRFGQAVFEDQTLAEAVEEMNRYSHRQIRLPDPALGRMRISGVYRTGDNEAFARSAATLLDLGVRDVGGTLVIERSSGG